VVVVDDDDDAAWAELTGTKLSLLWEVWDEALGPVPANEDNGI
jgi:hypothetical protein